MSQLRVQRYLDYPGVTACPGNFIVLAKDSCIWGKRRSVVEEAPGHRRSRVSHRGGISSTRFLSLNVLTRVVEPLPRLESEKGPHDSPHEACTRCSHGKSKNNKCSEYSGARGSGRGIALRLLPFLFPFPGAQLRKRGSTASMRPSATSAHRW